MEECCNKIVESISTNAPTGGQGGSICGGKGESEFGDRLYLVNSAPLQREIRAGTYIVGPRFIYSCNGCIKSIQLAVSPTSILKDAQGQERSKFHTFIDKTGDSSIFQRREDVAVWNSSVVSSTTDRKIIEYRPIGQAQLCFSQGDVFGFTIEAGSDVAGLTRFPADSNIFVLNTSNTSETISRCPQLSDSGLYISTANFSLIPLIHIVTGKISTVYRYSLCYEIFEFVGDFSRTESPVTTNEPSTTESTTLADIVPEPTALADSTTELFSQTAAGPTPDSGINLIGYVVGGFAGAICIFLVAIIVVVVLRYLVRRMKHNRDIQYCGNNPSELIHMQ